MLAWRNDPVTRRASFQTDPVAASEHERWFERALADPNRLILVGERNGGRLGVVRFDFTSDHCCEVNIAIAPTQRGKGFGTVLLRNALHYLERHRGACTIVARVRSENTHSRKLFERCGFVLEEQAGERVRYVRDGEKTDEQS